MTQSCESDSSPVTTPAGGYSVRLMQAGREARAALGSAVRRGGLRLKLIGMSVLMILATVGVLTHFFVTVMEQAVTEKAFEVAATSLERIAEFSGTALIERGPESRVTLLEILQQVKHAPMHGIIDVSVYATEKDDAGALVLSYFAGFADGESGALDAELRERILVTGERGERQDQVLVGLHGREPVEAYRFTRAVEFDYRDKRHLLGVVLLTVDRKAILGPVQELIRLVALTTLAVLMVSVAFAYALGRRLSRPILTVAQAAGEVARGNLDVKLDITTNDELQELGNEFNSMVQGLRERERMQKYVSSSTIDMIRNADDRDLKLGGDHKSLTFLISDIRNFTALAEQRPPAEVVSIINFYLNLQAEVIRRHGGDIDKFIGDAVMAVFYRQRAIERAIAAAIEIQQAIRVANTERASQGLPTVEVGIGINYGKVLVGNIGSQDRMDFTSIGAAVNMAFRLCSEAPRSAILLDTETYSLTARKHSVEHRGTIQVKGFMQPVDVVSILT